MITTYAVSLDAVDCTESDRLSVVDAVDDWLVRNFPLDERGPGMTVRSRADSVYRVTITDAHPSGQHVETIAVTVFLEKGRLWFDLRSFTSPSGTKVVPLRTDPQPPTRLTALVRQVLSHLPARDANYAITDTPHVASTAMEADELLALLEVPGRRLPVVVELTDGGKALTSVAGSDLVGLAHIFQVTGTAAISEFVSGFGYSLLDAGTIMIVWPGRHDPEILRIRELPPSSVRAEWQRLVAQVAGSAARSVAAPRVPPPPRDDIDEEVDDDESDDGRAAGDDAAVYIDFLESQVNALEASMADADRIIAEQKAALQKKGDQVDELVLHAVNLELQGTSKGSLGAVPNMREAMRLARMHCPFLEFHRRAFETGEALQGPDPLSVLQDLVRLNVVAADWQTGRINNASLTIACRSLGLNYAAGVSDTAEYKFGSDYAFAWRGRTEFALAHIRNGKGARLYRVHLFFDDDAHQVVVAYVGRHLRGKHG